MQHKARGDTTSSPGRIFSPMCALPAVDRSPAPLLSASTPELTHPFVRFGREASPQGENGLVEPAQLPPNSDARLATIGRSACSVAGSLRTLLSTTLPLLSHHLVSEPTSEFENAISDATLSIEQAVKAVRGLLGPIWIKPEAVVCASAGIQSDDSLLDRVARCGIATNVALDKARLIAHDLGNHLSAALLVLSRLSASEPMTESLSVAALSVEHALASVRDLLDLLWDKIGANESFDPNASIETNKSLLAQLAGRGMTLKLALDPSVWDVSADPHGFILALANLVANARDATKGRGGIEIATADVFLWGQYGGLTGQFVEIGISDKGEGMETEAQARAFELFYTTRNDPERLGLGLVQVYDFAMRSRGAAEIESRGVGLGTTVRLYLPRAIKVRPVKHARNHYH